MMTKQKELAQINIYENRISFLVAGILMGDMLATITLRNNFYLNSLYNKLSRQFFVLVMVHLRIVEDCA